MSSTDFNLRACQVGDMVAVKYRNENSVAEIRKVARVRHEADKFTGKPKAAIVWLSDGTKWTGSGDAWGSAGDKYITRRRYARRINNLEAFMAERAKELDERLRNKRRDRVCSDEAHRLYHRFATDDEILALEAALDRCVERRAASIFADFARSLTGRMYS